MTRDPASYAVPAAGSYLDTMSAADSLVDLLLGGRSQSLERSAARVSELISERLEIRDRALAEIEENVLTVRNLAHALYRPGQPPTDSRDYLRLRLEELRLDRDRRTEIASCWRDTIEVGKELGQLVERIEAARLQQTLIGGGL
jgi:hypothetical protein